MRRPPQYHVGAKIVLHCGHGLAMQLRDNIPGIACPGFLTFFGGGIETGETLAGAAARELEEETGLRFTHALGLLSCVGYYNEGPRAVAGLYYYSQQVRCTDLHVTEGTLVCVSAPSELDDYPILEPVKVIATHYLQQLACASTVPVPGVVT